MKSSFLLLFGLAGALAAQTPVAVGHGAPLGQVPPGQSATAGQAVGFGQNFQAQSDAREDADYRRGRAALDRGQWSEAIAAFEASISHKSAVSDAALYWKAYALSHAGRRAEALSSVDLLAKSYPSSRWLNDAQALAAEMQSPSDAGNISAGSNDDIKMIALNSLMQSEPDQAIPILTKILKGNASPKVKERALFVLTQSGSPEAAKMLSDIAHGNSNPELQLKAIHYIGAMGSNETRLQLASLYDSTSDKNVKRAILQSYMISGSKPLLVKAVKSEKDPELQKEAVRQLAISGGVDELWQIYQSDNSIERKAEILKSLFLTGDASKLTQVAQNEKNPQLRVAAIRSLGLMGQGRGEILVGIYKSDQNREVRDAVLNALFISQDGKSLVELARAETNPEMKREIVNKMALIHSKETTDYMLEILK